MATFVVLPPRELLEHACQEFAGRLLPGLVPPAGLADAVLARLLIERPGTFVVHREDLPDGDTVAGLVAAFGAEPGDIVSEIGPPRAMGPAMLRTTIVPSSVSVLPAA